MKPGLLRWWRQAGLGAVLLPALLAGAQAACLDGKPLRGVNMGGAEFGSSKLPGVRFKDYTYPSRADLRHFAELGANTIRLPFRWERVQPVPKGPFEASELDEIAKVVGIARELNLCVILDAHNFGTHGKARLGTAALPISALVDFWLRMRAAFPDPTHTALGLMNEPARAARADWARAAQETLSALRGAGSHHLVLVSGAGWSGAHDWLQRHDGLSNAQAFAALNDPLRRSLIEVHQYADADASGTRSECMAPARMRAILERVAGWAEANQQRLFLGEFGVAPTPACLATLKAMLESVRDAPWAGWTYWAAGAWWGPGYVFGVHPIAGQPRPQTALLREEWEPR